MQTQELKPNGAGAHADPRNEAVAAAASRAQAAIAAANAARAATEVRAAAVTRTSNPAATAAPRQSWLSQVRRGRIERPLRALFYGPDGVGKAQPVDTPVLTPNGFQPIGEIRTGDFVIGRDGAPTEVLGVYPQGIKPTFLVTTTDGASTRCCEEHLWFTQRADEANGKVRSLSVIAKTIARSVTGPKASPTGFYPLHRIPVCEPVQFDWSGDLPIDPYLLGVLLGDGSLGDTSLVIHKPEMDVLERATATLVAADRGVIVQGKRLRIVRRTKENHVPSEAMKAIRELGLAGCHSGNKFIPERYLHASVESRLSLLRGLCDTDGHVIHSGTRVEYTTASDALRDGVLFLARSLGAIVTVTTRSPKYRHRGETKVGSDSHRMMIFFPDGTVPVSSEKHLARWRGVGKSVRAIKSVEQAGDAECVCIRVAAPDGLYVTENFIVTHNSTLAAGAPNPIFLCSESGTEKLDVARLPEPKSWTDVLGACQELATAPHDFQTFVVDTVDWLEPLVLAEIVRKDEKARTIDEVAGGFQKGYDRAIGEWRRFLGLVERLWSHRNMNVVLLAHGVVRTFLNPIGEDFERWTLKLWESKNANTPSLFREWVDLVGFCNFEFGTQELGQKKRFKGLSVGDARYIHTAWSPAYDAKTRFAIPPVLPLNWDDIVAAIRAESPMDPAAAAAAIEELIPRLTEVQQQNATNALAKYAGNARALTEVLSRIHSLVGNP